MDLLSVNHHLIYTSKFAFQTGTNALCFSEMKNVAWNNYQLFLAVARHGGLTGAAGVTELSPATVGRRMVEFERTIGRELFVRSQSGYSLTADGRQLLDHLGELEAAARKVETWRRGTAASSLVRIALGTWNAWLIAENFPALSTGRDDFRIDLFIAEQRASLAHREADIGIRAFEPEEQNLAKVLLGEVAYAAYRARNSGEAEAGRWPERWIAVDKGRCDLRISSLAARKQDGEHCRHGQPPALAARSGVGRGRCCGVAVLCRRSGAEARAGRR